MADKRDKVLDVGGDPPHALRGFLSESTRRVRRALLGVSVAAIAVWALDVEVGTVTVFGVSATVPPERVGQGLGLVLLYFLMMFSVYAMGDVILSRGATDRALDGLSTKPRRFGVSIAVVALGVLTMRMLMDLGVPLVLGVVALVVTEFGR
jgi:hypothetical protein